MDEDDLEELEEAEKKQTGKSAQGAGSNVDAMGLPPSLGGMSQEEIHNFLQQVNINTQFIHP
jgi:hypothetical protein